MKSIAFLVGMVSLVWLPTAAHADDHAPKPTAVPPHACGTFYPEGQTGTADVQVSLTIGTGGQVTNAFVTKTSDHGIFDTAALKCVAGWSYIPALRNGTPVEVNWIVHITLSRPTKSELTIAVAPAQAQARPGVLFPYIRDMKACASTHYPSEAIRQHMEGSAIVSVTVSATGSAVDTKIAKSSGNALLDTASVTCIALQHFIPGTINGTPSEMTKLYKVGWKITNDNLRSNEYAK